MAAMAGPKMQLAAECNSLAANTTVKTGQAPITRKSIPVTKLAPPNNSIKIKKPTRPSERCGVNVAEKMVGSRSLPLSGVIVLTIPK